MHVYTWRLAEAMHSAAAYSASGFAIGGWLWAPTRSHTPDVKVNDGPLRCSTSLGALQRHSHHRRTVRDYERLAAHHETYIYWAMIIVMTRRLARQRTTTQPQAA